MILLSTNINLNGVLTTIKGLLTATVITVGVIQSSPIPSGTNTTEGYSMGDRGFVLNNNETIEKIEFYSINPNSNSSIKIFKDNGNGNVEIVYSENYNHPGNGFSGPILATPFLIPSIGTYYAGSYAVSPTPTFSGNRIYKSGNLSIGSSSGWSLDSGNTRAHKVTYIGGASSNNKLTVVINGITYELNGNASVNSSAPQPQQIGVVGFHSWSNQSWAGPTNFPNALFFTPTFDNSINAGSSNQLANIKSQIDAWVVANNITDLRAVGFSGGSFTGLAMAAAYPGYFKKMSLWLILYDLVAWSGEATGGDLNVLENGMGGTFLNLPKPYFERSPKWTLDNINTATTNIILNGGLIDNITPIHHSREAFRRLKGMPNVTVQLNEWNIGHTFGSTEAQEMINQISQ